MALPSTSFWLRYKSNCDMYIFCFNFFFYKSTVEVTRRSLCTLIRSLFMEFGPSSWINSLTMTAVLPLLQGKLIYFAKVLVNRWLKWRNWNNWHYVIFHQPMSFCPAKKNQYRSYREMNYWNKRQNIQSKDRTGNGVD